MSRVNDIIPEGATPAEIIEQLGEEDGCEAVAFKLLMIEMGNAVALDDVDDEGRPRVGQLLFDFATGKVSGRAVCLARGIIDVPDRPTPEEFADLPVVPPGLLDG